MKTFIACCIAAKADLCCRHPGCLRQQVRENLYQAMYGTTVNKRRYR